jgi:ABC-type enterochelin transport system permease subunit
MQSEGVFIAIVSTVVATVDAAIVVVAAFVAIVAVAVGAFGTPLLGLLVPNVEVVIFDGRPRARATIVSFDGVARCKRSGRDTTSATDAGGPLDG